MSGPATSWAWGQPVDGPDKLVLLYLALMTDKALEFEFSNAGHGSSPESHVVAVVSRIDITRATGLADSTVSRTLSTLRERELLTANRPVRATGRTEATRYALHYLPPHAASKTSP